MKRNLLAMVLVVLLTAASISAYTAGKTTVDPNTQGAEKTPEVTDVKDQRLSQKVTYEAKRQMVSEILDDLSESTGITLKAGYNNLDWQVRDRRMNIFAKDIPLNELMDSMARVMKFKWSRSGDKDAWTYRLYADKKALLEAEKQAALEEERRKQLQTEKIDKIMAGLDSIANLSPADLAKIKDENPYLYLVATTGIGTPLKQFLNEVPDVKNALVSGSELNLSAEHMSPAAQASMGQLMQNISRLEGILSGGDKTAPSDLESNIGQVTIKINRGKRMMQSNPMGNFLLGDINLSYPGHSNDIPILDPDSKIAKLTAKTLIKSIEENKSLKDLPKEIAVDFMQAVASDIKTIDSGEAVVEHPDDPGLHVKVKLKPTGTFLEDIEGALAEASKMPVVSDNFGKTRGMGYSSDKEVELRDALNDITGKYRYNWEKQSQAIEFRDRDWYKKKLAMVPEAWLEKWRQTLKKTGTLELDDLAEISALTDEQLNLNIRDDEVLNQIYYGTVMRQRDLLRFYACLSTTQRAEIFTDAGLDLRSVTASQLPLMDMLITSGSRIIKENPDTRIALVGTSDRVEKQLMYDFRLTGTEDENAKMWNIMAPKYSEPAKDQTKDDGLKSSK